MLQDFSNAQRYKLSLKSTVSPCRELDCPRHSMPRHPIQWSVSLDLDKPSTWVQFPPIHMSTSMAWTSKWSEWRFIIKAQYILNTSRVGALLWRHHRHSKRTTWKRENLTAINEIKVTELVFKMQTCHSHHAEENKKTLSLSFHNRKQNSYQCRLSITNTHHYE